MDLKEEYLKKLKERQEKSRIKEEYQLIGLEIARMLNDNNHKALYMKLAKENNGKEMFGLAKDISSKKNIKNMGAYFMKIFFRNRKKSKPAKKKTKKQKGLKNK